MLSAMTNRDWLLPAAGQGPRAEPRRGEIQRRREGRRLAAVRRPRRATTALLRVGRGAAVSAPVGGRPGPRRHRFRPLAAVHPVRRDRGHLPRPWPDLRVRELRAGAGRRRGGPGAAGGSGPRGAR
jgi:hypothetical protein